MPIIRCPGQDTRFWKQDDIFEVECPKCSASVEFFKDDPRRRCHGCGQTVLNPKIRLGCAEWCRYARECLGTDAADPAEGSLCDVLIEEMRGVFGDDERRIQHALNVLDYADQILKAEGGSPIVVKAAAILHDIGIKEAEHKHGSAAGEYQEIEGPPIARRILEKHNAGLCQTAHICGIVGSHHSSQPPEGGVDHVNTIEFSIVWDADWLVNAAEVWEGKSPEEIRELIDRTFRTERGRALAARKYLDG